MEESLAERLREQRTGAASGNTIRVARWGGEEFCILLAMPEEEAVRTLDTLLAGLSAAPLVWKGKPRLITRTLGATALLPGDRPDDLLHRADNALYAGKAAGRNRVIWLPGAAVFQSLKF